MPSPSPAGTRSGLATIHPLHGCAGWTECQYHANSMSEHDFLIGPAVGNLDDEEIVEGALEWGIRGNIIGIRIYSVDVPQRRGNLVVWN